MKQKVEIFIHTYLYIHTCLPTYVYAYLHLFICPLCCTTITELYLYTLFQREHPASGWLTYAIYFFTRGVRVMITSAFGSIPRLVEK